MERRDTMERRDFFKSLIAGGAAPKVRERGKNNRAHHKQDVVYHGPMTIPVEVAEIIATHPGLCRTTHRHLVSRYSQNGRTWIFRCQIPKHRAMVGEIIRTPEGKLRIHCWSAARLSDTYRSPDQIIAASGITPYFGRCPDCGRSSPEGSLCRDCLEGRRGEFQGEGEEDAQ